MSKTVGLPTVPALRSCEGYAQVSDEHQALVSERAGLLKKRTDLAARWRATAEPAHVDDVGAQVIEQTLHGALPGEDRESLAEAWREADRRIHQLDEGIRVHGQHHLQPARLRAAVEIAQRCRPGYAEAARALAQDAADIQRRLEALGALEEELRSAGGDVRELGGFGAGRFASGIANFRRLVTERFGER